MPSSPSTPSPKPTASSNHLLIDGDILAFVSAAAAQGVFRDVGGWHMPIANETHGEAILENMLHSLKVGLNASTYDIYLSDTESNWRHLVDDTYKRNRTGERPLLLTFLKDYLRAKHRATHWAGLEADDILGILATDPAEHRRTVVVGRDKDFKSIPGLHHSWKQDVDAAGHMLIREVTRWEADRFHLIQSLSGDRVDGFAGCPGIGMDRAANIIDSPTNLVPTQGVKTRGVNKGESVTRWMAEPTQDLWACIVSHYQKGMSQQLPDGTEPVPRASAEQAALTTARLARILRHGEYDRETGTVTLWTPDKITEEHRP